MKFLRFVCCLQLFSSSPLKRLVVASNGHNSLDVPRLFSTDSATNHSVVKNVKFLSQIEAINVDQELFNEYRFSVDQLMELAGLSVASAVYQTGTMDPVYQPPASILIICGPGNNGGDGLVAAKHLKLFGYTPSILYPKQGKSTLISNLVHQCKMMDIEFLDPECFNSTIIDQYRLVMDAVFGFSYKPPLRPEFRTILEPMSKFGPSVSGDQDRRLISIDIPSGWHVEDGPPTTSADNTPILRPDCLVSLTAPKLCAKHFQGSFHWLGGRFVPPKLADKYQLNLPAYPKDGQCLLLDWKQSKSN